MCSDGIDNDGDGFIDAEDPGCRTGTDDAAILRTAGSPAARLNVSAAAGRCSRDSLRTIEHRRRVGDLHPSPSETC